MDRTWKMFFTDSNGRLKEKIVYVDEEFIFHSDSKYDNPKKSMIEIEYQNMEILGKNFIAVSYRDKEEKIRDTAVLTAIAVMQAIMAKTGIEQYIKEASLNTNNTIMNELVTSMLHAPAGTEFLYQVLIFIGIAVIVISAAGAVMRR